MTRFKTVVALLLLACWLPATSHCLLEVSGALEPHGCCSESAALPNSKGHVCSSAFPTVEAQDKRVTIPMTMTPVSLEQSPVLPLALHICATELPVPCASPPEFLKTWNHYACIALPARAPSSPLPL